MECLPSKINSTLPWLIFFKNLYGVPWRVEGRARLWVGASAPTNGVEGSGGFRFVVCVHLRAFVCVHAYACVRVCMRTCTGGCGYQVMSPTSNLQLYFSWCVATDINKGHCHQRIPHRQCLVILTLFCTFALILLWHIVMRTWAAIHVQIASPILMWSLYCMNRQSRM